MGITFDQLLEALEIDEAYEDKEDKIEEACEYKIEEAYKIKEEISARPNMDMIYHLMDEYEIPAKTVLDELLRFLPDDALKDFADYNSSVYYDEYDEVLDEDISDKGDLGPRVLAELEKVVNNNTKFKLDSDPDGKIILTDPRQLRFKVDINNDNFVLIDSNGKIIIRTSDPKDFIKRVMVFITD